MSRRLLSIALFTSVGLLAVASEHARGEEAADGWSIIKQAIKAKGGRKTLAKHKAVTWTEEGTYFGMGAGLPYDGEMFFDRPKFRMTIKGVFTIVFDGKQGWSSAGGTVTDMKPEQLKEQSHGQYAHGVNSLESLKKDGFKYTVLPVSKDNAKVGEKAVVGVKVESQGQREIRLYFDKETHLLAKSSLKIRSEEAGGKLVDQEILFGDYKEVDGEQFAHKFTINHNGKPFIQLKIIKLTASESLDAKLFEKP
jgi:hypothetical protein